VEFMVQGRRASRPPERERRGAHARAATAAVGFRI
jgi:hypothetical protein